MKIISGKITCVPMFCYELENEPDFNGQSIVSMWRESEGEKKLNNARSTKII